MSSIPFGEDNEGSGRAGFPTFSIPAALDAGIGFALKHPLDALPKLSSDPLA
jgi:hypothetical protein